MASQKPIEINGVNVSAIVPTAGYKVRSKYVYGANNMTMQSGGSYKDEVAILSVVEVPFMPLTDAQLHTLMQNLYTNITCLVTFYDPDAGVIRTMTANREVNDRKSRGIGADGNYYWSGVSVVFEECE